MARTANATMPHTASENGEMPNPIYRKRGAHHSRKTKALEDWLVGRYFGSMEDPRTSKMMLELVNVISAANELKGEIRREKIVPSAAWFVFHMSEADDGMCTSFLRKAKAATDLIIRDPKLASEAAERFILLRTLPVNVKEGDPLKEYSSYRRKLSGILVHAALLRYS
jgi:hypothetical protein